MARLYGRDYPQAQLSRHVGTLGQIAGVRLVTLADGVERGVRVLEFRTGTGFEFDVIVDRALDIGRCEYRGRPLAWTSSTGFAGPWYYEPEGLGFLRNFGGGLLTTCGLDHTLFMAEDTAQQYHYPPKPTETYGLHGRISNRPARLVAYGERWDEDECVLFAEGEVLQASVLGEQLLLRRRIEARVGESQLRVHDEVVNVGHHRTPHMLLYHVNIGWPVLDQGSELLIPAATVEPLGEYSTDRYHVMEEPQPNYTEQVFEHQFVSEDVHEIPVAVVNRRLGLGAFEVFRKDQFPHFLVWRMLGEGNYVLGIEPSTNSAAGRLDARERGKLIELQPGESRSYDLELGALAGEDEIERFAAQVRAFPETQQDSRSQGTDRHQPQQLRSPDRAAPQRK